MDIFLVFVVILFPSLTRPLKWKRGHIIHVKYDIRDLYASSRPIILLIFFELTISNLIMSLIFCWIFTKSHFFSCYYNAISFLGSFAIAFFIRFIIRKDNHFSCSIYLKGRNFGGNLISRMVETIFFAEFNFADRKCLGFFLGILFFEWWYLYLDDSY